LCRLMPFHGILGVTNRFPTIALPRVRQQRLPCATHRTQHGGALYGTYCRTTDARVCAWQTGAGILHTAGRTSPPLPTNATRRTWWASWTPKQNAGSGQSAPTWTSSTISLTLHRSTSELFSTWLALYANLARAPRPAACQQRPPSLPGVLKSYAHRCRKLGMAWLFYASPHPALLNARSALLTARCTASRACTLLPAVPPGCIYATRLRWHGERACASAYRTRTAGFFCVPRILAAPHAFTIHLYVN